MSNEPVIIDPKKLRIGLPEMVVATINTVKESTTATDGMIVLLDRVTGEFRVGSFPSDMKRTIEMMEKGLERLKHNAGLKK